MRKLISILLLVLASSFLVISCGGDDEETYTCAPNKLDGTCAEGKFCTAAGQCVVEKQCSVTCKGWETCNKIDGVCKLQKDRCNAKGDCDAGFDCDDGNRCVEEPKCDPACGANATCDDTAKTCSCDEGFEGDPIAGCTAEVKGVVGSACASPADCTETGALCNTNASMPGGYCTVNCTGMGTACGTGGICVDQGQGGNCFKKCAIDTECPRAEYVCQQAAICAPKCKNDAGCGSPSLKCNTATGHCEVKASSCSLYDNVGCDAAQICKIADQEGTISCIPDGNATKNLGEACSGVGSCKIGLICAGQTQADLKCIELCDDTHTCSTGNCNASITLGTTTLKGCTVQ